ncbi:hypothetical protein L484_018771 [Morus notabilis]|uniref:Uncharacterized protein n=1 Tax=Morus notabilis TaxID=981085 RepID=W9QWH4_9ROSA|nr:hypothetical protein L484_018771 [Morus notabilis]
MPRIVGFGIERNFLCDSDALGRQSVLKEEVCVLKLCVGTECLLITKLIPFECSACLAMFLNHSRLTFVGMRIKQDMADLETVYKGIKCRNMVELRPFTAAIFGARRTEAYVFVKLAETTLCLDLRALDALRNIPPEVVLDDWGRVLL